MFSCKSKKEKYGEPENCLYIKESQIEIVYADIKETSADAIIILLDGDYQFATLKHDEAEQEKEEIKQQKERVENPAGPFIVPCRSSKFTKSIYGIIKWFGDADLSAAMRVALHYAMKHKLNNISIPDIDEKYKKINIDKYTEVIVSTLTDSLVSAQDIKIKLVCSKKKRIEQYLRTFKEKFRELEILGIKVSI